MTACSGRFSYGPVPSRRLGKSLGINNIPAKVCTYSCVYCQIGKTTRMQTDRSLFFEPQDIFLDVQDRLAEARQAAEQVDYLTFVPDGEPTLDVNLGKGIRLLKTLDIPVGVITNSSLLWRDDVREEMGKADWVSLKIDAMKEVIWRQINRPHKAIRLSEILDGILAFAETFTGKLVTETMLVQGINDNDDCMKEVADFLHGVRPHTAYLSIPTRPPAQQGVQGPTEEALNRMFQILSDKIGRVEYLVGYEGNAFAHTDDIERDLLSITAVHPMRREAVDVLLSRAGYTWEVVDRLVTKEDLAETTYNGHIFYLRRFTKDHEATNRKPSAGQVAGPGDSARPLKPVRTCRQCIPCFMRQASEAMAMTGLSPENGQALIREVSSLVASCDWGVSPPAVSQRIQRLIRERTGCEDPYREMKADLNRAALNMLAELKNRIPNGMSEQEAAVRMAIGGNVLDAGAKSGLQLAEALRALDHLFEQPLEGDWAALFLQAAEARHILFLADNAGEIVFDRLLIERLGPEKVTVAVRGGPVINDATLEDAQAAGLCDMVQVISNGSDAPGTILEDCSPSFREVFETSDLIIAKGQGNYETLSSADKQILFLFQVKCPVIAARTGAAVGTMIIRQNQERRA